MNCRREMNIFVFHNINNFTFLGNLTNGIFTSTLRANVLSNMLEYRNSR